MVFLSRNVGGVAIAATKAARCVATAVSIAASTLASACGSEQSEAPPVDRYVIVALVAAPPPAPTVGAAQITVRRSGSPVATLCVRVAPDGTPATFALARAAAADPLAPFEVEIRSFAALSGADVVAPGEEFGCPTGAPPPTVGPPQTLTTSFCADRVVELRFVLGSTCACGAGRVCAAGLSALGAPCRGDECCPATVADACALPSP